MVSAPRSNVLLVSLPCAGRVVYRRSVNSLDHAPEMKERLMRESTRYCSKAERTPGPSSTSPSMVKASLRAGVEGLERAHARMRLGRVTSWRTEGL